MTFPKFVKFEEAQEVEFGEVAVGGEFVDEGATFTRMYPRRDINATGPGFSLAEFQREDLVTIHRSLETKPLGECKPGDVVRADRSGDIAYMLDQKNTGISINLGKVLLAGLPGGRVYLWPESYTVTVIGKAVCDG